MNYSEIDREIFIFIADKLGRLVGIEQYEHNPVISTNNLIILINDFNLDPID